MIPYLEFCKKFNLSPFPVKNGEKALHFVFRFSLSISAAELWPYIADTSSFNRKLGLAPRTETEIDDKNHVTTTLIGLEQQWVEEPWTWFYQRHIQSNRTYSKGIAHRVQSNFILEPTSNGVDFYVNFSWIPKNFLSAFFLKATSPLLQKNFEKVFATIQSFVQENKNKAPTALKVANDFAKNVNLPALEKAADSLKDRSLNLKAIEGLCQLIKKGDDFDLYRISAFAVAKNLRLPRKDFLETCLESVRCGLLSLTWDVICPHCRGVRVSAESLGQIPEKASCQVCNVDFQTDSLESIEVVFHVNPLIRKVKEVLYCAAEPAKKEHIQVQQKMEAFQILEFKQKLKLGRHRIRATNPTVLLEIDISEEESAAEISWNLEGENQRYTCGPEIQFHFENTSEQVRQVCIEQLWWKEDVLHPADIFALPQFRDVLSREALDSNVKISMGTQVVLFTDIVNSTIFYHQLGDAAAFKQVKNHFVETYNCIQKYEGSVIKTIGDSTMACFSDPDQALRAAVELQSIFPQDRTDTSIRLRISLHVGPVIAVHLLHGLDLFGTTVNEAAKLQSLVSGGEIAFSELFLNRLSKNLVNLYRLDISEKQSKIISQEIFLNAYILNCFSTKASSRKTG